MQINLVNIDFSVAPISDDELNFWELNMSAKAVITYSTRCLIKSPGSIFELALIYVLYVYICGVENDCFYG